MNPDADSAVAEARVNESASGPPDARERLQAINELAWSIRTSMI